MVSGHRKDEHIEIALRNDVEGPLTNWLENVRFIHNAAPEVSLDEIDTRTKFLGYELSAPLIIEAVTGGSMQALEINRKLGLLASRLGIAIEVGSQRPMLVDPSLEQSYRVVRDVAKDVPVIANIGGTQLTTLSLEHLQRLVKVVEADALSIHLNVAHEMAQPEGDRSFKGVLEAVAKVVEMLDIPIIVKEVGFGMSMEVASALRRCGVKIIDVAGAGGTNWVRIERLRLRSGDDDSIHVELDDWGLPTAVSIVEARAGAPDATIIASGGIRKGLDVAKSIALGADIAGVARPALLDAVLGTRNVETMIKNLKVIMSLLGAKRVEDLKNVPIVVSGELASWICARGLALRNRRAYIPCISC